MNTIPLGITVTDKASGLKGTLTHLQVELDQRQFYAFKPEGLNPDTGKRPKSHWLVPQRIDTRVNWTEIDLPLELLGASVKEKSSGFAGMVVAIILHVNGCVHLQIQPKGKLRSGEIAPSDDFDLRELSGPGIVAMSKKAKPSPSAIQPYSPNPVS